MTQEKLRWASRLDCVAKFPDTSERIVAYCLFSLVGQTSPRVVALKTREALKELLCSFLGTTRWDEAEHTEGFPCSLDECPGSFMQVSNESGMFLEGHSLNGGHYKQRTFRLLWTVNSVSSHDAFHLRLAGCWQKIVMINWDFDLILWAWAVADINFCLNISRKHRKHYKSICRKREGSGETNRKAQQNYLRRHERYGIIFSIAMTWNLNIFYEDKCKLFVEHRIL